MALIYCPECEKKISNKASTCPHCGSPIPKKKKKKWILIFVAVVIILSIVDNMSKDISNNKNDEKPIVNETPLWEKFDLTEDQWASFSSIFDKCGFTEIVKVEKEAPDNKGITPYYVEMKGIEPNKVISPGKTSGNIIYVEITSDKKLHEISVNYSPVYKNGKVIKNIRAYTLMTLSEQYDYISFAKKGVKQLLKAPSTAKFCKNDEYRFNKENGIVTVFGYVDAQNSFGAMIRSNFVLKYDCVAQKEISIEFDGKVYQYQ